MKRSPILFSLPHSELLFFTCKNKVPCEDGFADNAILMKPDQIIISNEHTHHPYINCAYLIDGQPLYCDGFESLLKSICPSVIIHRCHESNDLNRLTFSNSNFSIAIIDILSFGDGGIDTLIDLRVAHPNLKVIISTAEHDPYLFEWCQSLGVAGFIPKKSPVQRIRNLLINIALGMKWTPGEARAIQNHSSASAKNRRNANSLQLTQKEIATLKQLVRGLVNREIAEKMGVTESTTKSHVSSIIRKLGVINRTQVFTSYQSIQQHIAAMKSRQ